MPTFVYYTRVHERPYNLIINIIIYRTVKDMSPLPPKILAMGINSCMLPCTVV